MNLQGERLIPASIDATWLAINDPVVLQQCVAGCESMERTGPDAMVAVVALRIGPITARFKGNVVTTEVQAPNSFVLNFDGQGGVAGFGKGSALIKLADENGATRLTYSATTTVGGKIAQVGSRLIEATAGKIIDEFFTAFVNHLTAAVPQSDGAVSIENPSSSSSPAQRPSQHLATSVRWIALAIAAVALLWWLVHRI